MFSITTNWMFMCYTLVLLLKQRLPPTNSIIINGFVKCLRYASGCRWSAKFDTGWCKLWVQPSEVWWSEKTLVVFWKTKRGDWKKWCRKLLFYEHMKRVWWWTSCEISVMVKFVWNKRDGELHMKQTWWWKMFPLRCAVLQYYHQAICTLKSHSRALATVQI